MLQLAAAAGWAADGTPVDAAWQRVRAQLRQGGRWLLVYDNVEEPHHLQGWLPPIAGHVIITSRHHGFTGIATPVEVDVFDRPESIDLLSTHLPALNSADADRLADALGDLPLALAQATGLLSDTHMSVEEYLGEFHAHTTELLAEGRPLGYPVSLAAAIQTTLTRLHGNDPAAVDLLYLAAVLAPEPIPLEWFRTAPAATLPEALRCLVGRALSWRKALARIADLGLATISPDTLQVHRLTQAVLRDQHSPDQLAARRVTAAAIIVAVEPDNDGTDPDSWPTWNALLPHLLNLDPASGSANLRHTACNGLWYLLMSGQYATALPLAQSWHSAWYEIEGADHPDTLWAGDRLASTHMFLGCHEEAHDLHQQLLDRYHRLLGPDHPRSLECAHNLASDLSGLRRYEDARDLDKDTLERRQRVLGADHPHTLASAYHFATDLRHLGQLQEAYDLDLDTLRRRRRVLGPEHLQTLNSAHNVANDLWAMGQHQQAYDLHRDTLTRARRVLGPDHPDTLTLACHTARGLRRLGLPHEAYNLDLDTLERRQHVLGPDHPHTRLSAKDLVDDLRALGDHQEADRLLATLKT